MRQRSLSHLALAIVVLAAACAKDSSKPGDPCVRTDTEQLTAPPIHTPRWAFEPWISKDISSRDDTYAFVQGFRDRDIPVGTVVLDSPWETHYNTFVPSPTRYGDFPGLVSDMHARGVKVVLWIVPMVNTSGIDLEPGAGTYVGESPNYEAGVACKYYVSDSATFFWWKGFGSAVDFFNPSAAAWWHRQQDPVLEAGIDGWKLDFAENYIKPTTLATKAGDKSIQEYSEEYYRDFLAYGAKRRGREFLTMTRAWDESYDFPGRFYARREHAPVTWMGDNRRDWFGLADALNEMFVSARAGYVVVGSDIGGYLDRDDKNLLGPQIPFDQAVFARWVAMGALSPFMQLHGRANVAPWTVPDRADETVAIYRYWAKLHHELIPFFYSLAEEAYAGSGAILSPIGEAAAWPNDYRFMLGQAFLVAPILDATGTRNIALPAGARWYDWFNQGAASIDGGTVLTAYDATDRSKIPLFVREGSIVPVDVEDDVTKIGDAGSKGSLTVLVFPGLPSTFRLHDEDDKVTVLTARSVGGGAEITMDRALRPLLLRVRADAKPAGVTLDGATTGFIYDPSTRTLLVKVPAGGAHAIAIQ